jgi:hypothetical protein
LYRFSLYTGWRFHACNKSVYTKEQAADTRLRRLFAAELRGIYRFIFLITQPGFPGEKPAYCRRHGHRRFIVRQTSAGDTFELLFFLTPAKKIGKSPVWGWRKLIAPLLDMSKISPGILIR